MLILVNSCILIEEDICIKIKSVSNPNTIEPIRFYYWLSSKAIKEQVGKITRISDKSNIRRNKFINLNNLT